MKYRNHNLRKGRVSIPGIYYHIIIKTHQQRQSLTSDDVASIIFETFDWLEAKGRLRWMCIMIMPDHIHAVIELGKGQTLAKVLHSLKLFTARKINGHLLQQGTFWQQGYSDWAIRTEETLNNTIRYCYANPVKEGIVKSAQDYPYWRCKFDMVDEVF